jgi:endonuclease/exonuclease/phosphatase (EEP) superfamily protein YafD
MSESQRDAKRSSLGVDWWDGVAIGLLKAGCVMGGAVALVGLAGGISWVVDLGSHFQAQYFVSQLACTILFLLAKRVRWALVAMAFLCVPLLKLAPYYLVKPPPAETLAAGLRVVSFNVLSSNDRHAETLAWIRQTDPDLVYFPEVTRSWEVGLEPLKATLPHALSHPQEDNFGWALFSKYPIREHEFIASRFVEVAMVRVVIEIAGRRVVCYGVHPLPPMSGAFAADRDQLFQQLAKRVRQETGPVIVAGDFNATPWSHSMRPLAAAGLRDTQLGHGFSATWQRRIPILAIPIDLLLVAGDLAATARWTGPDLGSDHRPIIGDLQFSQ